MDRRQPGPAIDTHRPNIVFGCFCECGGHYVLRAAPCTERSDITAKIHMSELPLFFIILFYFSERYGLVGVASAWVIRMISDAIVLGIAVNASSSVFISFRSDKISS